MGYAEEVTGCAPDMEETRSLESRILEQTLGLTPEDVREIKRFEENVARDSARIKSIKYRLNPEKIRGLGIVITLDYPLHTREEVRNYFNEVLMCEVPLENVFFFKPYENGNGRVRRGYTVRHSGFLFQLKIPNNL